MATEMVKCPECNGSGAIETTGMAHDPKCDGTCRVGCPVPVQEREPCYVCDGSGEVESYNCVIHGLMEPGDLDCPRC